MYFVLQAYFVTFKRWVYDEYVKIKIYISIKIKFITE